ncbi:MAG: EamA family transporter [bacterium]
MEYIKYAYIALLGWGFWAIGSKVLSKHLDAINVTFWIALWSFIILVLFIIFFSNNLQCNHHSFYALPVGFVSFIAVLSFYRALTAGPASVVIPLTNLYVLFPVLYGFVILKEPITLNRVLGIFFALLASILLSK